MGNQSSRQNHQINGAKPKKFVHWKSAERPSPPGRPILIPVSDQQPDVITLKWERPRTDGGSPIIGYIVEHRRMGSAHWVRATPSLVPITEVAISGLEPGWRYQFRAIAENIVGKSDPSELSDPLTVTLQRNAITVPRFVKELTDAIVEENDRIEMKVEVLGHPSPEINWFKDGFEIFSSRRTKIVNDNETSILIIHQCAFTDEGEIKCTATNRAGHVVTKANLRIVAPPKIRLPRQYEDGLIVEAGEVLRLKVGLGGQPPPVVVWTHEGVVINSNVTRYELVTNEKSSSLKIDNIKRSDRGEYTLRASNNLGEDFASFLVTVTSKPNPPGKVKIAMSFGRSVTLTWAAPDDDGGCKIGNYIVEYFRIGWNVWLKASTTRQLTATLHDLIEGSEYKFRVKAENPYGLSDPSSESDILFIPDPKRGITKPPREHIAEEKPPVPPKRRALSPIKNLLGVGKKSSRSPSPNNRSSPSTNVQLTSEFFENEELHREMSYGTSNEVLRPKEAKRKISFKDDRDQDTDKIKPTVTKVSEGTQSFGLQKVEASKAGQQISVKENENSKLSVNQRFQHFMNRSPSLAKRKMSLPEELLIKLSTDETKDKSPSPKSFERRDSLILEKVQQFFKKSPSPARKNILPPTDNRSESLEKITSEQFPEQQLQRKDSLIIIEKVQNFFRRSPSPARKVICEDSSKLPSNVDDNRKNRKKSLSPLSDKEINDFNKKQNMESKNTSLENEISQSNPPHTNYNLPNAQSQSINDQEKELESNQLRKEMLQRPFTPNPRIEISAPKTEPKMSFDIPVKDGAHSSNEFMLVLHPIKKSKETEKQESFDLELEEALSPPPISFSVPDLMSEQLDVQMPPLRRSVSSTEILYERAMARFYEAVELEEAENTKNRKLSEDLVGQDTIRKRLGSISQEERLSFERRMSLRRRLSGEISTTLPSNLTNKWDMKNIELGSKKLSTEHVDHPSYEVEVENKANVERVESVEYESDYTESTASSSGDSMEKFKTEIMARTRSTSGELETYHPRKMDEATFSPYRSPTPDQSALVLTKPLPLPSSDFVPKPILKRSSVENVLKDELITNSKLIKPEEEKPKESGFSFTNIFKRDKSGSEPQQQKNNDSSRKDIENIRVHKTDGNKNAPSLTTTGATVTNVRRTSLEEVQKKKLELRQSSEEERMVVVEHYSDIVKELGSSRRRGVPLYMRGGEYSKSDEETEKEDEKKRKQEEKAEEQLIARVLERPRLSIVERLQSAHVQAASKSAMQKPLSNENDEDEKNKNDIEPIETVKTIENGHSVEQSNKTTDRQSRRRPLVINKNDKKKASATSSRANSTSRPETGKEQNENGVSAVQRRVASRNRVRAESKSPAATNRRSSELDETLIETPPTNNTKQQEPRPKTPEELLDEAQETVRSTVSYFTDLGLFIVACWVYIFKDARLVLPILALLVYRQLGEALNDKIPDWIKRKKQ